MNTWNDLGPYTIAYDHFLDEILHYGIGSEFQVSDLAYTINRKLYEKAVEEGYILCKIESYTYRKFLVVKLPIKPLNEEFINSYFL